MGPGFTEQLETLVSTITEDLAKFNGGNKSAGTRVRKGCQELKKLAQDIRVDVQAQKNA